MPGIKGVPFRVLCAVGECVCVDLVEMEGRGRRGVVPCAERWGRTHRAAARAAWRFAVGRVDYVGEERTQLVAGRGATTQGAGQIG